MMTRNVMSLIVGRFVPCAALALMTVSAASPADARWGHGVRHHTVASHRHGTMVRRTQAPGVGSMASNFAAMVVDANSGRTLYAVNEDAPRHPASITKVMTLYLLFEKLEEGKLSLESRLSVSAHAAAQAPTKLGLRPGSTIAVEDAIKAIVTKSANDMAVAVAENIAGDETSFAQAMTEKAHALGMTHTFYHNASGLPDMRQLTTARDLTILGRVIRERFPRYYRYFSTPSFTYAGSFMPNHNHLLGRIEGMDGIKTGYTAASGFNLLGSVNRDGRHIVSVVLGGRSAAARDHVMQALIETHIEEASATPTTKVADAGPVEEPATPPSRPAPHAERQPPVRPDSVAQADDVAAASDDAPAEARVTFSADETPRNVERQPPGGPSLIAPDLALPPTTARRSVPAAPPVQIARADLPMPPPKAVAQPIVKAAIAPATKPEKIRPAFIAGAPKLIETSRLPAPLGAKERQRLAQDGSTSRHPAATDTDLQTVATATPSSLHWVMGAQPVKFGPSADKVKAAPGRVGPESGTTGTIDHGATRVARSEERTEPVSSTPPKGEWVIQIGATDDAAKATALLNRARSESHTALASARPFTEKVQKGDATLYRARFAGLEPTEAEAACKSLKRSGFACFTTRN